MDSKSLQLICVFLGVVSFLKFSNANEWDHITCPSGKAVGCRDDKTYPEVVCKSIKNIKAKIRFHWT